MYDVEKEVLFELHDRDKRWHDQKLFKKDLDLM